MVFEGSYAALVAFGVVLKSALGAWNRKTLRQTFLARTEQNCSTLSACARPARLSRRALLRQALVRTFQSLPDATEAIFVLSILAAGQGLTLTNAHTVVFGELRWVPGELLAAEELRALPLTPCAPSRSPCAPSRLSGADGSSRPADG